MVVERGSGHPTIRRWVIAMVEQFAEHAALALHNAWLTEERESQLRVIQGLEQQLRAQNEELEVKVAERTEELREVITHLEEIDEQRRRLLEHVVRAAEEERTRIAHDIHDDPVQKMAALKMRLELLRKKHPGLPDMDEALEVMRITIQSMRTLLFDLSPPTLEEEGLGSSLAYLLEHSNSPFDWAVDDDELDEEPAVQTSLILYRIAQEAFANARKHAEASRIRVTLQPRDDGTLMQIVDDGVGFVPQDAIVAAPGHLGLAAIRERAEMAGGWSKLWSLPGQGTTLEVWLPRGGDRMSRLHPRTREFRSRMCFPSRIDAARRRATAEAVSRRAVGSDGSAAERRSHGTHPTDARGRRGSGPRSDVRAGVDGSPFIDVVGTARDASEAIDLAAAPRTGCRAARCPDARWWRQPGGTRDPPALP